MRRPRVYIAGPLTDGGRLDEAEIARHVANAARAAADLIEAGFAPLCPHLSVYLEKITERRLDHATWMECCLPWLDAADAVLRLDGKSAGAEIEANRATDRCVPVFRDITAMERYFGIKREGGE
ncbi:MAG: DUF1937 family protein [Acidiferrobacteraceae bacterium]